MYKLDIRYIEKRLKKIYTQLQEEEEFIKAVGASTEIENRIKALIPDELFNNFQEIDTRMLDMLTERIYRTAFNDAVRMLISEQRYEFH